MTNNTQIRTKRISFILALLVIAYVAVDTYLFTYHQINNNSSYNRPCGYNYIVRSPATIFLHLANEESYQLLFGRAIYAYCRIRERHRIYGCY